jgi:hypothetical protein
MPTASPATATTTLNSRNDYSLYDLLRRTTTTNSKTTTTPTVTRTGTGTTLSGGTTTTNGRTMTTPTTARTGTGTGTTLSGATITTSSRTAITSSSGNYYSSTTTNGRTTTTPMTARTGTASSFGNYYSSTTTTTPTTTGTTTTTRMPTASPATATTTSSFGNNYSLTGTTTTNSKTTTTPTVTRTGTGTTLSGGTTTTTTSPTTTTGTTTTSLTQTTSHTTNAQPQQPYDLKGLQSVQEEWNKRLGKEIVKILEYKNLTNGEITHFAVCPTINNIDSFFHAAFTDEASDTSDVEEIADNIEDTLCRSNYQYNDYLKCLACNYYHNLFYFDLMVDPSNDMKVPAKIKDTLVQKTHCYREYTYYWGLYYQNQQAYHQSLANYKLLADSDLSMPPYDQYPAYYQSMAAKDSQFLEPHFPHPESEYPYDSIKALITQNDVETYVMKFRSVHHDKVYISANSDCPTHVFASEGQKRIHIFTLNPSTQQLDLLKIVGPENASTINLLYDDSCFARLCAHESEKKPCDQILTNYIFGTKYPASVYCT